MIESQDDRSTAKRIALSGTTATSHIQTRTGRWSTLHTFCAAGVLQRERAFPLQASNDRTHLL